MDEQSKPHKGSPQERPQSEGSAHKNENSNTSDMQSKTNFDSTQSQGRPFRSRRSENQSYQSGYDRQYTPNPYQQEQRSRYDEVQPRYNASRQDFEQRQQHARPYRRFDSQPPRHSGTQHQSRPRVGGYDQPPRRYQQGGTPYNNDRPPYRTDNGGFRHRGQRDAGQQPYPAYKKQGRHSNDPLPKKVRERPLTIIKALAKMQYASRNICLQAIQDGLVAINGVTVTKQNAPYFPSKDLVSVNNVMLQDPSQSLYIAYNKPRRLNGSAESGEPSVMSVLNSKKGWYFPAGCLNRAASGIVVMTNDPAHKTQNESPIAQSPKEYHIKVHKTPKAKEIELLKKSLSATDGISIENISLLKTTARHAWIAVTLLKGKLTELRKAIKEAGFEILAFERYRVGGFTADELSTGSWKRLNEDEINLLKSSYELLEVVEEADTDESKPKWQKLYQQWFKSI